MNNPAEDLLRISMSHGLTRCLHAVAELGIADALGESPRSVEELARDTGTDAGVVLRSRITDRGPAPRAPAAVDETCLGSDYRRDQAVRLSAGSASVAAPGNDR